MGFSLQTRTFSPGLKAGVFLQQLRQQTLLEHMSSHLQIKPLIEEVDVDSPNTANFASLPFSTESSSKNPH